MSFVKNKKLFSLVRPGTEDMLYKVFESSTAGTYTYICPYDGIIDLDIVGGGGGNASSAHNDGGGAAGGGGSGGYSHYESIPVIAGQEFTIVVGAGKGTVWTYEWGNVTAATGGESSVTINEIKYYASGGTGGPAWSRWSAEAGVGGFGETISGNDGFTVSGNGGPTGQQAASVYRGYGVGCIAKVCYGRNLGIPAPGGAGYVRIILKPGNLMKRIF